MRQEKFIIKLGNTYQYRVSPLKIKDTVEMTTTYKLVAVRYDAELDDVVFFLGLGGAFGGG